MPEHKYDIINSPFRMNECYGRQSSHSLGMGHIPNKKEIDYDLITRSNCLTPFLER